jgi:hypothetical protein
VTGLGWHASADDLDNPAHSVDIVTRLPFRSSPTVAMAALYG